MQAEALLDHAAFVRELAKSLTYGGEDPDDLVQQTWLKAMEHPPEAGPGMKGWLATVLRNVLRQDRRARGRRVAREAVAPPPREMPTPEEIREREAVRSEVVTAVLDLDEPYRDVILMRYYEDLPPRKIAERTGDPVETVKTRLVRARGKLRERLDERHGGDGRTWGISVASLALWPGEVRVAPASGASIPFAKIAAGLVAVAVVAVLSVSMINSPTDEAGPERASVAKVDAAPPTVPPETLGDGKSDAEGREDAAGDGEKGNDPTAGENRPDDPAGSGKAATGASIGGRVLDQATKEPVEGATVRLVAFTKPRQSVDVQSDEEGNYRFADVPTGVEVRVFIRGRERIVAVRGMPLPPRILERGESVRQDLTAIRRMGIDLRIHVRLPEGVAAPEKIKMTQTTETISGTFTNTSVDIRKYTLDPETLTVTVFLCEGSHKLGFESDSLRGELPPRVVTGDGPAEDAVLELRGRTGFRLRLVDAGGKPLGRGPIRMLVIYHVSSVDPAGNARFNVDSLGYHETDERGELDLNPILPALNVKSMHGNSFGFALEGKGIFPGTMLTPNFEITVKEILALRDRAAGGPVVIDVPAVAYRTKTVAVRSPDRKPVEGVRVVGRPADAFADEEYVSDGQGRIVLRLLKADAMMPRGEVERLHLLARPPWVGRVELSMLGMPEVPGGPQSALVVRRAAEITLKLVNDDGKPIAWAEVVVDGVKGKTDAAGTVKCTAAVGATEVEVEVPGHMPREVRLAGGGEATTVRLERARKLRVRVLMPDGTPALIPLIVRVVGEDLILRPIRSDPKEKVVVYLVPRRAVKIETYPQFPRVTGSMEVGPDQEEVELKLTKK